METQKFENLGTIFSTPVTNTGARLIDLTPTKNMGIPLDGGYAQGDILDVWCFARKKRRTIFLPFPLKSKQYFHLNIYGA